MRVSSLQIFQTGVRNMQIGQSNLAKLQEQVSTGKNLNRPSDDPVAAAQILKFRRELAVNETYVDNITVSQRRLDQEEVVLQQVKDASDRIKELAIRGNNGTMNNQNRASIAGEIKQVQQFILGLMNTKDAQGEYLFAGAKGGTQPFVDDGLGGFSYNGDSEVRFIQTGPVALTQSTDSGREVFQVVPGDVGIELLNQPAGVSVSLSPAAAIGEDSPFESYVATSGKQDLTLNITGAVQASVAPPVPYVPASYELIDGSGTVVSSGAIDPSDVGDSLQVSVAGVGLELDLQPPAAAVAFGDIPTTTSTLIRPVQANHSILTTAQKLIDRLEAPAVGEQGAEQFAADMAEAMVEIDLAQDGMIEAVTGLGGRMVTLENQQAINDDFTIFTKAALSNLEDLDYAEAISKFSFQEVALQAAQQTFSRVNNLSLFNFL